jgi:hypothetical protein
MSAPIPFCCDFFAFTIRFLLFARGDQAFFALRVSP